MIQLVPFHVKEVLYHENCVVIRNNHENVEFGFPFFDVLPVKLSVRTCLDLINFIKDSINYLDEGQSFSLKLAHVESSVEDYIIVRKCFGEDRLLIDFAFCDISPTMVDIQEIKNFLVVLETMLDIKLLS